MISRKAILLVSCLLIALLAFSAANSAQAPMWDQAVFGQVLDVDGNPVPEGTTVNILTPGGVYTTQTGSDGYYSAENVKAASGDDILVEVDINGEVSTSTTQASTGVAIYKVDVTTANAAPSPAFPYLLVVGFIGTAGILGFLATEIGKLALISLFLPLYTKLRKEEILDNYTRGRVYQYIQMNPGDHYTSILKGLALPNGQLAYHLRVLERNDIIKSRADGMYKRFYPRDAVIPAGQGNGLSEAARRVLGHIDDMPGITQKEIAKLLGVSHSSVSYQIAKLVAAGKVKSERKGRKVLYFPNGANGPVIDSPPRNLGGAGRGGMSLLAILVVGMMLASGLYIPGDVSATAPLSEIATATGGADNDLFGFNISASGDINNDGTNDIVIGAPGASKAYVYFGGSAIDGDLLASDADVVLVGASGKSFGWSVDNGGNPTGGDSNDDVVVGDPASGKAYVISGATVVTEAAGDGSITVDSDSGVTIMPGTVAAKFGQAVAIAGDLNDDGTDDVAIGAPYTANGGTARGGVYIYLGASSMDGTVDETYLGTSDGGFLGITLTSLGDINSDNVDDLGIGEVGESKVALYYGSTAIGAGALEFLHTNKTDFNSLTLSSVQLNDPDNSSYDDDGRDEDSNVTLFNSGGTQTIANAVASDIDGSPDTYDTGASSGTIANIQADDNSFWNVKESGSISYRYPASETSVEGTPNPASDGYLKLGASDNDHESIEEILTAGSSSDVTRYFRITQNEVGGYYDLITTSGTSDTRVYQDAVATGQFQYDGRSYVTSSYSSDTIVDGTWTFNVLAGRYKNGNGATNSIIAYLYAKVYSYNGGSPSLLFQTSNDDFNLGSTLDGVPEMATWTHEVSGSTSISSGDRIVVDIWVDITDLSSNVDCVIDFEDATTGHSRVDIPEAAPGGSSLEHKWVTPVFDGASITFNVEGYRPTNSETDNYKFYYSFDDSSYSAIQESSSDLVIDETSDTLHVSDTITATSDILYVKVMDTNEEVGTVIKDTVYLDHMWVNMTFDPFYSVEMMFQGLTASYANIQLRVSGYRETTESEPMDAYAWDGLNWIKQNITVGTSDGIYYTTETNLHNYIISENLSIRLASTQVGAEATDAWAHLDLVGLDVTAAASYALSGSVTSTAVTAPGDILTATVNWNASGITETGTTTKEFDVGTSASPPIPFYGAGSNTLRYQTLYLQTDIEQAGYIDKVYLQKADASESIMGATSFKVYLCHAAATTLSTSFSGNYKGGESPTLVLDTSSFDVTGAALSWLEIDIDNVFEYNNVDPLILEIQYIQASATTTADVYGASGADRTAYRLADSTGDAATQYDFANNARFDFITSIDNFDVSISRDDGSTWYEVEDDVEYAFSGSESVKNKLKYKVDLASFIGADSAYLHDIKVTYTVDTPVPGTLLGDSGSSYGQNIAGVGDVNNDGTNDIVVGNPGSTNGDAYIYYGGDIHGTDSITNTSQDNFTTTGSSLESSNPNNNITATAGGDLNLDVNYLIYDDFEYLTDADLETEWTINDQTGGFIDPSTDFAISGSKSAKFSDANDAGSLQMSHAFSALETGIIEISVYIESSTIPWVSVLLDEDSDLEFITMQLYFSNDGNIYNNDDGDPYLLEAWSEDTWYTVKIEFDCAVGSSDIYINDVQRATKSTGGHFLNTATSLAAIRTDNDGAAAELVHYIDLVKVYTSFAPLGYYDSSTATALDYITSVTPTWTSTLNGQTLTMRVSRDGGTTWYIATSGTEYSFTNDEPKGNQLCYNFTMSTTNSVFSPVLHDITIAYKYTKIGVTLSGASSGSHFGAAIVTGGNVSGNDTSDIPDLVIGAPDYGSGSGRIYVLNGSTSLPSTISADDASYFYYVNNSGQAGEKFGFSLALPGDITGDGTDDLLVGAPYHDGSTDSGRVYVLSAQFKKQLGAPGSLRASGSGTTATLTWEAGTSAANYDVYKSSSRWGFSFGTYDAQESGTSHSHSWSVAASNPLNATVQYYIVRSEDSEAEIEGNWNARAIRSLSFYKGWNFFSWNSLESVAITDAFAALTAYDGSPGDYDYDKLIRWDASSQTWANYTTSPSQEDFTTLDPGYAYVINVNNNLTWFYNESCGGTTDPTLATNETGTSSAPTGFTATYNSGTVDNVDLTWDEGVATSYYIYRSSSRWGFDFSKAYAVVTDDDSGPYTWTDTEADDQSSTGYNSTTYYYIVRAVDGSGNEEKNWNVKGIHRLDLKPGWNYITWDLDSSANIADVLGPLDAWSGTFNATGHPITTSGHVTTVQRWKAEDNGVVPDDSHHFEKYRAFKPNPLFVDDFTTFDPGYGYSINIAPDIAGPTWVYTE